MWLYSNNEGDRGTFFPICIIVNYTCNRRGMFTMITKYWGSERVHLKVELIMGMNRVM
jgi:hypothetical protein